MTEPSQAKIKLKVGPSTDTPTPSGKKITIHVGGQRDSADTPAAAQPAEATTNGQRVNGTARTSTPVVPTVQLDKARSVSVSVPSPSPSVQPALKAEDAASASPAGVLRQPSVASGQATPAPGVAPVPAPAPAPAPAPVAQPQPVQHNPLVNGYMEQKHPRRPGKGKLAQVLKLLRLLTMNQVSTML